MQFLNPLFLIGLSAIAIPIAIHFFNLRRYKKVYFSDISKLEKLAEETRRQSRLKHLLILAARILAVAFLAVAFAQPVIPPKESALLSGSAAVGVYIDNSFSMEGGTEAGTLLDEAKRKAKEIVAGYSPSDKFMLITNDMVGSQFRTLSNEEFSTAVDEVEPSPATPMLSTVAKRIFAALANENADNRTAFFISDLQKSTADVQNFPHDTLTLSHLIPLHGEAANNLFIDSMALGAPAFVKGNVVNINVFVRNSGNEDVESVPLQLVINGKERAVASANISKNSQTIVPLQFTIDNDNTLHGKVAIADHPITFDDEMFFCINPTKSIEILSINQHSDNQYLKRLYSNDSLIHYQSCPSTALGYEDLNKYRVLIANELSTFTTGMADALGNFVQNGGTLLIIPSNDMDISSFNHFAANNSMPQVAAFTETEIKASNTNTSHQLYKNVFAPNKSDADLPNVFGHYPLKPSSSAIKESIITLANGNDLLCCTKKGKGCIYLFTSPLQSRYTDFGNTALFVPTLYNIALYSENVPAVYHFIDGNATIPISTAPTAGDSPLKIKNLDGSSEAIPEIITSGGATFIRTHQNIQTAGNYTITNGTETAEGIAFNYSRCESVMDFLSDNDLSDIVKTLNNNHISTLSSANKPLDKIIRQQREGKPLWHIFVILSLLMLATEISLIKLMK